ncbi:MAG: hypothetical protein U0610_06400 [bacterium]
MRRAWLALVALWVATPAFATTMVALDVGQLARHSNAVVIGKVGDVHVQADKPGVPLTRAIVHVSESLRGDLSGDVEVLSPGFPGSPSFASGDELVLFITSRDGLNVLTGYQQGHFRVLHDKDGNRVLDRALPTHDRAAAGSRSLDDLIRLVRAAN